MPADTDQVVSAEATPRPSALAEAISEAIDSTSNHAELIDRVIAEHANILCSYCGKESFRGHAVVTQGWSDDARKAMTDHILSCPERPEAKLVAQIDTLKERVKELEAGERYTRYYEKEFSGIVPTEGGKLRHLGDSCVIISGALTEQAELIAELRNALTKIRDTRYAAEYHDGSPTGPDALRELHNIATVALAKLP